MKWWPGECKRGDMIRVKSGTVYHYGIFVSEDEVIQFGEPPVGSLIGRDNASVLVCSAPVSEFSRGNIVEVASLTAKEKRVRIKPEITVETARSRIGEGGYNLLHNNCEHFVYECVFGIKKSTQEDEARERWRARPFTAVYVSETLSAEELLLFAARDCTGEIAINLRRKRNGRIYFENFCFSVSVYENIISVAASAAPSGVGIAADKEAAKEKSVFAYRKYKKRGALAPMRSGSLKTEKPVYLSVCADNSSKTDIYLCRKSGEKTYANNLFEEDNA